MSERYEQAVAEADRITLYSEDRNYRHLFMEGVEWADAHPHSTPEALVAAYEDGQRDAVEKGLAKIRITADQCNDIEEAVHEGVPLGHMLRRLGIEVEGDDE